MACTTATQSITLEASNVYWGQEDSACITPVTGLTGGEYFTYSTPTANYAFWTSVDSVGVAPVIPDTTIIEVAAPATYNVAEWIAAFITAAETTGDFLVTNSTDNLSCKIENQFVGTILNAVADVDTGFTFETLTEGHGGFLGATKEGIELTFETTEFEVTTNQQGTLVVNRIIQGTNASASFSLLELTEERYESIIGKGYGDLKTPAGGTQGIGYGISKLFQSTYNYSGKMVFHPIRLPDDDRASDFVFWQTVPKATTINLDGTDTKALAVEASALPDFNRADEINTFMIGDWKQDFR